LWTARNLPIGVQIIAPPWKEALALRVAAYLEKQGIVSVHDPST
jgi:aspartyl-tRNA(Asn)/glutamyl-tRNA(Gln) amidotransferase subunit A